MYKPSIRVPMLVRYPGKVKPGATSDNMVLNLDLAPTLLQMAGLPVPSEMQGRSILPLAEGEKVPWRQDWLYEYYEYPGFENVKPCRGVRTTRYKYIEFFLEPKECELYDLEKDPDEMRNLYGQPGYEDLTRHLQARMEELRRETNDHYRYQPTGLPLYPGLRQAK